MQHNSLDGSLALCGVLPYDVHVISHSPMPCPSDCKATKLLGQCPVHNIDAQGGWKEVTLEMLAYDAHNLREHEPTHKTRSPLAQ